MLTLFGLATLSAGPLWPTVCTKGDKSYAYAFCDQTKTIETRAAALVKELTLEEKQSILDNGAAAVPRIGLPAYQWWSEGLHGPLEPCVKSPDGKITKCPTSFPAASAMAAAFNDTLYLAAGSAVGVEGRAISNLRDHNNHIGDGLTYWAPNANMERDPRWGRNQEAPGEDPHLTSQYISHYVRGLQEGEDPDHVQIVATCKHFIANSLEHSTINGTVVTRHNFDAQVPMPDLVDYYMPAFKACVQEGRALGIMCSYNAVNGVPMCANRELLTDVLRGEWGFDGYVTSDCSAIKDIYVNHNYPGGVYPPDAKTAAAVGLKAGCDSDCGGVYGGNAVAAVEAGYLSEETIDVALVNLAKIQMRLGLFDPKEEQAYFDARRYGIEQIDTPAHQQLALEAALQSIVLLKNEGSTLPLAKGLKLALVGPHVEGNEVFMSNYHGERCAEGGFGCITSPLAAISNLNAGGTTVGTAGVEVNSGFNNISAAVAMAGESDAVVLLVGIDGTQEHEEYDRSNCTLPGLQPELIKQVAAVGKPTVMVLIHGGAMCLGALKDAAPSIVDAFYGGERASEALAQVLFGDYNPSGKLPVTMYPQDFMLANPLIHMSVSSPPGRTHLYYSGAPEFGFGSGLSYSTWAVKVEQAASSLTAGAEATFSVSLTNQGPLAGRQRVLAFVRPKGAARASPTAPRQKLWGYKGAELAVGSSANLLFSLSTSQLAQANAEGERVLHPGDYEVIFSDGSAEVSAGLLTVSGAPTVVEPSAFRRGAGQQPSPVAEVA